MQEGVPLKMYTTFKIGGHASYFALVRSLEDLTGALQFADSKKLPWFVLGGGSNLLIGDAPYKGVVLKMEIKGMEWSETAGDVLVSAGAGETWDDLVAFTVSNGWYGLENLSFIPGSVGASPIQNIGAYGVEVKECIQWVEVFDTKTFAVKKMEAAACGFGYRTSFFKEKGEELIVLRVGFKLARNGSPRLGYKDVAEYFKEASGAPTLVDVRKAIGEIRQRKFPDLKHVGTAGSYFKNPIVNRIVAQELMVRFPGIPIYPHDALTFKVSLAWILDHVLHLKGACEGSVGLFEHQPLVLVNLGGATARDVHTFAKKITEHVFSVTQIAIVPEVVTITT